MDKLETELISYNTTHKAKVKNNSIELSKTLSPIYIIMAGFVDGINPCAIAMLLFFISFTIKIDKKYMIKTCIYYIFGNFLAYFLLGTSIIKVVLSFRNARYVYIIIYAMAILFSLKLMLDFIGDIIKIKNGSINKVKTQLSSNKKKKIQNIIQKYIGKRTMFFIVFSVGFLVSIFEFSCTGQIYLPTIVYMISLNRKEMVYLLYLLLYNLAFITPMILIGISIYKGKEIFEISDILVSKLKTIKVICLIFFTIILFYMVHQLLSIL